MCVVLILTGALSDILLVAGGWKSSGRPQSGYKPNTGYKPKKGLSNKAKIAAAGVGGLAGGMVLGSVLSGGRSESHLRQNRYQIINGTRVDTWSNGGVVSPLGSLWLISSMFLLAPCVAA